MTEKEKLDLHIYTLFTISGRENQKPNPDEAVIETCEYAMEVLSEKRAEIEKQPSPVQNGG